jgi:hypothetical protein
MWEFCDRLLLPMGNIKEINDKAKGGRGKVEILRNKAIVTLYEVDKKLYNTNTLGKLFSRDRKTIKGIIERFAPSKQNKAITGK